MHGHPSRLAGFPNTPVRSKVLYIARLSTGSGWLRYFEPSFWPRPYPVGFWQACRFTNFNSWSVMRNRNYDDKTYLFFYRVGDDVTSTDSSNYVVGNGSHSGWFCLERHFILELPVRRDQVSGSSLRVYVPWRWPRAVHFNFSVADVSHDQAIRATVFWEHKYQWIIWHERATAEHH